MNEYDDKKYISCKGCGCEIETNQRKCPYCKTINILAPKEKFNKLLIIIPAVFLAIAIIVILIVTTFTGGNNTILNPNKIETFTVLNGSGTNSIGSRAELTVDKKSARNLSAQEFNSFIESEIAGRNYKWFTIKFDDGTGIVFTSCDISLPIYGKVDKEGMLESSIGTIKRHTFGNTVSFDYNPV